MRSQLSYFLQFLALPVGVMVMAFVITIISMAIGGIG